MSDLKSGNHKLESFEIGPMDVKLLDNVAVVQGSVTEKRTDRGQDTSGHGSWMDVFVKRGDKWVIVRSHFLLGEVRELQSGLRPFRDARVQRAVPNNGSDLSTKAKRFLNYQLF